MAGRPGSLTMCLAVKMGPGSYSVSVQECADVGGREGGEGGVRAWADRAERCRTSAPACAATAPTDSHFIRLIYVESGNTEELCSSTIQSPIHFYLSIFIAHFTSKQNIPSQIDTQSTISPLNIQQCTTSC